MGVRAAVESERSGAPPEDALWAGKAAASDWDDQVHQHGDPETVTIRDIDWGAINVVDPVLARIHKAALEAAGIPAVLQGEPGWVVGLAVPPGSWVVRVLVPKEGIAEAIDLIANSSPVSFPKGD
jgi:hypothetical protein